MPWMPNGPDVDRGFKKLEKLNKNDPKQGLKLGKSSEKYGFYFVDGVKQFYVSSKARLSGDIGPGRLLQLRKYLKLTQDQFKDLCECRMTGPEYHQLIRNKLKSGEL